MNFKEEKRNTIIHIMKNRWRYRKAESLLSLTWNHCCCCLLLFFVLLLVLKTEKLTSLNYDDTFAYGSLHDIPIPNSTLETTFTPQQERAVLMEIFDQTDGHKWRKSTHWGNNSVSHCLWYGITCDQTNSYIISITLTKNKLVGLFQEVWGNFVICRVCVKVTTTGFQAILLRFCLPTWPPSFVLIFLLMNCLVRFPLKSYQIIFAKSSTLLPIGKGSLWWNSKGYWELDWAASSQSRRKHIEWHDSEEYCQIEEALVFGSWKWK